MTTAEEYRIEIVEEDNRRLREKNERLYHDNFSARGQVIDLQARLSAAEEEAKKWKTAWELKDHSACYDRLKRAEAVVETAKSLVRKYDFANRFVPDVGDAIAEERDAICRYEEGVTPESK